MRALIPLAFFLLLAVVGCSNQSAQVAIKSDLAGNVRQSFARGYLSQNDAAEDEILLISDPIDSAPQSSLDKPQPPLNLPPIRQVLSIRLHWRPLAHTHADSPAATNAVLHWYVYGRPGDGAFSMVHYVGTGFVRAYPAAHGADIVIENAPMNLSDKVGDLRDALGNFNLSGEFHVVADTGQFKRAEDDLNAAIAVAKVPAQ